MPLNAHYLQDVSVDEAEIRSKYEAGALAKVRALPCPILLASPRCPSAARGSCSHTDADPSTPAYGVPGMPGGPSRALPACAPS